MSIKYNTSRILTFLSVYVIFTGLAKLLHSDISIIIYGWALLIIALNTLYVFSKYKFFDHTMLSIFILMIFFTIVNLLINQMGVIDAIKIIGTQMFFFIGSVALIKNPILLTNQKSKFHLLILLGVPVLILMLQMTNILVSKADEELSSIFVNKNNAVVYFIALGPVLYYIGVKKKYILFYLIITVLLFKTLGALVALSIASFILYFRPTLKTFFYSAIVLFITSLALWLLGKSGLPILDRFTDVYISTSKLLAHHSFAEIRRMSFGTMVEITGSQDLSFLFRIQHWIDILYYFINAPFYNQLFGIGLNNIPNVSKIKLVAHNDWLKIVVELGVFYFILFISFMLIAIRQIAKQDRFLALFFLTILIYFFTENLLGNFLAISIFYYFLGLYYSNSKRGLTL